MAALYSPQHVGIIALSLMHGITMLQYSEIITHSVPTIIPQDISDFSSWDIISVQSTYFQQVSVTMSLKQILFT